MVSEDGGDLAAGDKTLPGETPTNAADTDTLGAGPNSGAPGDDRELQAGTEIGRYIVLGVLGSGGMGVVYAAFDPELDRRVALKLLRPARRASSRARERMIREAKAMARVSHPNVVAVHDVGEHEGLVYIAMELVDGISMEDWARSERQPIDEVVRVMLAAGEGLAAAHAEGLVHRDFKPANILIGKDGRIRVTDFGLARASAGSSNASASDDASLGSGGLGLEITVAGAMMGTPAYMAPEQFTSGEVTAQTDQFAFCIVMHWLLYGERPFEGGTVAELAASVVRGATRSPPPGRTVPAWIRRLVLTGLAAAPSERHSSMRALLDRLGRSPTAKRRTLALGAVVAVAVASVSGSYWISERSRLTACEARGDEIAQHWGPEQSGQLDAAFDASDLSFAADSAQRVRGRLDRWTANWSSIAQEACLVRRPSASDGIDATSACLDGAAQRFADLQQLLAEGGDEVVRHSIWLAAALPDPARCVDDEHLGRLTPLPDAPVPRAAAVELLGEITRARARQRAGSHAALPMVQESYRQAAALGHEPTRLSALASLADFERATDPDSAELHAAEAYFKAAKLRLDGTAITAAGLLAEIVVADPERRDEAARWLEHAEMIAVRSEQDDSPAYADMLQSAAIAHSNAGRYETSAELFSSSLTMSIALGGKHEPRLAGYRASLGNALRKLGHYERAERQLSDALELAEAAYGERHSELAVILLNLGSVYADTERSDEAIAMFERGLEIASDTYPETHRMVVTLVGSLGAALGQAGRLEPALELQRRALRLETERRGNDDLRVASWHNNIAITLRRLDRPSEAKPHSQRSIEIRRAKYGNDHPALLSSLMSAALIHADLGETQLAGESHLEAHRVAAASLPPEHPRRANTVEALAKFLVATGKPLAAVEYLDAGLQTAAEAPARTRAGLNFRRAKALDALGRSTEAEQAAKRGLALAREAGGSFGDDIEAWLAERTSKGAGVDE